MTSISAQCACEVDEWILDYDLEGYKPIPDSLSYRTQSAASAVVVKCMALIGTVAAGVTRIVAEVVCVGSLVGPPVYMIVLTVGDCVYNIALCVLEAFCDGACWAGLTVGELIWLHGRPTIINFCILGGYLACMTLEFAGRTVVCIAQLSGRAIIHTY
jgi:hypothetical protein